MILLAPLVRPKRWFLGKLAHSLVFLFKKYVVREFGVNSHDVRFLHFLKKRDPLQSRVLSARWVGALKNWVPYIENKLPSKLSVTVIQGREDETVEWTHNIEIIKRKFAHANIILLDKVRHQMVNEAEVLREEIFGLIGSALESDE